MDVRSTLGDQLQSARALGAAPQERRAGAVDRPNRAGAANARADRRHAAGDLDILEEWAAAYTAAEDGLHFSSLGIMVTYPWRGIVAVRRADEDSDEPVDELVLREDYTRQIRNPLLRFLHGQAYGRTRLPLYAGLEDRATSCSPNPRHRGPAKFSSARGDDRRPAGREQHGQPGKLGQRGIAQRSETSAMFCSSSTGEPEHHKAPGATLRS